ncbi:MAG TPA: preprotein translocase subunit SecG [Verrucomicrobiae bacterium]|nr:preprotein translocase subunit SecG [Verrucomicrobiae bacterium]
MIILTWLLTFLLVLDCMVLGLLVLIQLPKKEAGMGQAFGGAATDALFGAGSGTALTKMTKYAAGFFFILVMVLAVVYGNVNRSKTGDLRNLLSQEDKLSTVTPSTKPATNTAAAAAAGGVNTNQLKLNLTNANPAPATSSVPPVEKPK